MNIHLPAILMWTKGVQDHAMVLGVADWGDIPWSFAMAKIPTIFRFSMGELERFGTWYRLVNKLVDPENHEKKLMETSLPTPMTARVYVYLLEGNQFAMVFPENSNELQFLIVSASTLPSPRDDGTDGHVGRHHGWEGGFNG